MWQYVKLGKIADLYNCNLASLGIIFLRRTRTPTFLLAFLHISLIWVLKLSSSSNVTPSNFKSGDDLILSLFLSEDNSFSLNVLEQDDEALPKLGS